MSRLLRAVGALMLATLLTLPVSSAGAATRSFSASADAYVNASAPKERFGGAGTLQVGSAPTRRAYVRFDLSAVTEPVIRATLVLQATTTTAGSFDVRGVADGNWNERSITFQNSPALGGVLGTAGLLSATERRVELSGVTVGRAITVALTSLATPALSFASRETGTPGPRLELETADAGVPVVTLTSPAAGAMTNRVQPTFSGAAGTATGDLPTVTVHVYAGTAPTGTPVQTLSTTAVGGAWSVAASSPLTPGVYTAQAQQADDAGNLGRSAANTFTVDTTPPAVTLTSPAAGSTVGGTPSFAGAAGTAAGDGATITVRVYGGTSASGTPVQVLQTQASGGSWTVTPTTGLAAGTYTARAEQGDTAGNTGVSAASTFSVENSPPPPPGDYRTAVMSDTPRGYWRLGEASGLVAADQTANGLAGSYLNGVALGRPGAVSGDANTAVSLDGANDTVRVPNAAALNSGSAMSIETWIRPSTLPASSATIARKEGHFLLRLSGSGAVTFRLWKGGAVNEAVTPAAVPAGAWAHVVATWDGATMRVYVNAVMRASRALAAPSDVSSQDLYLGSSYNSYDFLAAVVDETAVYGNALPAARVTAHFDAAGGTSVTPSVRLLAPAAGSTMDATPNFGGAATPGAGTVTVRVYAGTGATGTPVQSLPATVQPAGTFSVLAATLAAGTYTAVAEQANGRSDPATFHVADDDPTVLAAGDIAACDTFGDEATAALLDRLPGTVATVGDHVYEQATTSDFTNCYDPTWGRHKARTRPTVGDHEYLTPGAAPYYSYFGAAAGDPAKGYQSYDLGAWHVISLNENCSPVGGCHAGSPQEQWLRADLAAHPAQCTLAILHKPRFSSGAIHGSSTTFQPFWQALYDHGADLVLSGDDHVYERFAPQTPTGVADPVAGIRQITVGTGGRSHYGFGAVQPNSQVRNGDTFGVIQVTLRPAAYEWRFVPEAGKTFSDSGTTACH